MSKAPIKAVFLYLPHKLRVSTSASGSFLQKWVVVLGVEDFGRESIILFNLNEAVPNFPKIKFFSTNRYYSLFLSNKTPIN